jgi:hypothetical protein
MRVVRSEEALMPATDVDDLRAELAALQAENDALRAKAAAPPDESAPAARSRAGWWRGLLSAICIVVATILIPVSIVGAWARVQLVEEDAFVASLAPLVDDTAVQAMIIDESMDAITAQVDFQQITSNVFDGVASLGLPPRAADALQLLEAPAANGLESLVTTTVTRVVESDAFAEVWATATRAAHRALVGAATSDGGGLVVRTDEGVGVQLGAVVDRVKQNLLDRGLGVAELIPTVDRVVIIGEGNNLAMIRTGYAVATTLGFWLPVITLVLFGIGILIARRRSTAVLGTGVGFIVGGGSLAVALAIGGAATSAVAGSLGLSADALDVIFQQLVGNMMQTALVLMLLGVLIAVLGWLMGGSAPALAFRRSVHVMNASARRGLGARGLNTGAFGTWLGRQRILVRVIIAVLAVIWLFALRPLSVGDIALVLVVSVAVAWVLELLQRRDDDDPIAETIPESPADSAHAPKPDAATAQPSKTAPTPGRRSAPPPCASPRRGCAGPRPSRRTRGS